MGSSFVVSQSKQPAEHFLRQLKKTYPGAKPNFRASFLICQQDITRQNQVKLGTFMKQDEKSMKISGFFCCHSNMLFLKYPFNNLAGERFHTTVVTSCSISANAHEIQNFNHPQ